MHTVTVSRVINAPFSAVWDALDDFGRIHEFHPLVEASRITNGVPRGVDAQRECRFYNGATIRETITRHKPNESYRIQIVDPGPYPLREAYADVSAQDVGQGRTRVTFETNFQPKFGPVGWLMAQLMMKPQFRRACFQNNLKRSNFFAGPAVAP